MPGSNRGRRRTSSRGRGATSSSPASAKSLDTPSATDTLARFSDAVSLLAVAHNSLSAKEISGTGDEEVAIRHALDALKSVYTDLDGTTRSSLHE
jgi:hypothetical protein